MRYNKELHMQIKCLVKLFILGITSILPFPFPRHLNIATTQGSLLFRPICYLNCSCHLLFVSSSASLYMQSFFGVHRSSKLTKDFQTHTSSAAEIENKLLTDKHTTFNKRTSLNTCPQLSNTKRKMNAILPK
ncbi:hypothetical protein KY290_013451 [Solanum tuberosum]|uniref:Uncharacterized protein n=1 Tax=Solanum tuberosum TaxID=4113 RepID=A0ABQ7VNU1_SOLTU|nr:hypothetical protein KY289_013572 [Solanum tuberosum]KAH0716878.1 hypothetical protein KY285_012909 [Solanum tuberosum]KAH0769470.1 hypothetical protein KY290_013451 [Solanum tuberosum]